MSEEKVLMKTLNEEEIREMKALAVKLEGYFWDLHNMMKRYEEIYFMTRKETPKGLNIDPDDMKETISSSGRDAVTGLKRIMDTADIHIKVKGAGDSDKIEAGLKKMLEVSSLYRQASVEKDLNLSTILHGPGVLMVEEVDDLIYALDKRRDEGVAVNGYVRKQLEMLRGKTPFLLKPLNARQSFPLWGAYGMMGHLWKYTVKGNVLEEQWGVKADANKDYEVRDLFQYEKRLVYAEGITEPLLACEWVTRDEAGDIVGSINIPIFTRYSGGTGLFHKPDQQMQPLLYAKAKGEWDLRENLFWTYVFTGIYNQGLPGPLLLVDPENGNQTIKVNYQNGLRYIVAKGTLSDPQVIDRDVMNLKQLMDGEAAMNTIQPQTLGQNTSGVTFSQFALASKAGLIPAQDPKEALEALYKDTFTHILQRIKHEGIENELIEPSEIPETFELEVTVEPDMEQDDLRNAQIATQLRNAGANVSDEWINSNLLKIPDSDAMFREKAKEDMRKAMLSMITQDPNILGEFVRMALGMKAPTAPEGGPPMEGEIPPGPPPMGGEMPPGPPPGMGGEMMPQTDAMIPPQERT